MARMCAAQRTGAAVPPSRDRSLPLGLVDVGRDRGPRRDVSAEVRRSSCRAQTSVWSHFVEHARTLADAGPCRLVRKVRPGAAPSR